jgi:hypothetical protein
MARGLWLTAAAGGAAVRGHNQKKKITGFRYFKVGPVFGDWIAYPVRDVANRSNTQTPEKEKESAVALLNARA